MGKALTTLKQVVSRYPYQARKSHPDEPCLLTETKEISKELQVEFAKQIIVAGAECVSFQLNEISYSAEVAAAMLKRQQAHAIVDAREAIVSGAVSIATTSIASLKDGGLVLSDGAKAKLVSNLLVVTSADAGVSPVVAVA